MPNNSSIESEPTNRLIEPQDVENENIAATPPHMNELDVGSGEFCKGRSRQAGFQAWLKYKIFDEIVVPGPVGLREIVREHDGIGGQTGDARFHKANQRRSVSRRCDRRFRPIE